MSQTKWTAGFYDRLIGYQQEIINALHDARILRLDGDAYGYIDALRAVFDLLWDELRDEVMKKWDKLIKENGFDEEVPIVNDGFLQRIANEIYDARKTKHYARLFQHALIDVLYRHGLLIYIPKKPEERVL
ncbi:MAG: hypothetical protein J7K23_04180 [Thermoproteales archaeon]|nr:hypothetical protein [Thermoproteales archaeon]